MNPIKPTDLLPSRRQFLRGSTMGLGAAALNSALLGSGLLASSAADAPKAWSGEGLHFPAKAKRVIFLFMAGAPSQIDLFDYKPDLHKRFKEPLPASVSMGQRVTAMTKGKTQLVAPSMFKFSPGRLKRPVHE